MFVDSIIDVTLSESSKCRLLVLMKIEQLSQNKIISRKVFFLSLVLLVFILQKPYKKQKIVKLEAFESADTNTVLGMISIFIAC